MEIEVEAGVFLAYHILMGLEGQCGHVFFSGRCGPGDEDVTGFVRLARQVVVFGELLKILGDGAFVAGLTGNMGDFLKILENCCGIHNQ